MANRSEVIVGLAKEKAIRRQKEILTLIDTMLAAGESVSFYSVAQKSHASKSYLYGNQTIAEKIRFCRQVKTDSRSDESKDVIIKLLQRRVKQLEVENETLKSSGDSGYKAKYEALKEENAKLREQLKVAYTY